MFVGVFNSFSKFQYARTRCTCNSPLSVFFARTVSTLGFGIILIRNRKFRDKFCKYDNNLHNKYTVRVVYYARVQLTQTSRQQGQRENIVDGRIDRPWKMVGQLAFDSVCSNVKRLPRQYTKSNDKLARTNIVNFKLILISSSSFVFDCLVLH